MNLAASTKRAPSRLMGFADGTHVELNFTLTGTHNENEYSFMMKARELYRGLIFKMYPESYKPGEWPENWRR